MVAQRSLSESDVAAIREELSAGNVSTVWFTPAAVGVVTGGSAKVVSVGEVAEGEFIQVRPAGSRDVMFCSSSELTRVRPPRRRKPQPEPVTAAAPPAGKAPPARTPLEKAAPAKTPPGKVRPSSAASAAHAVRADPPAPVSEAPGPAPARRSAERRATSAEVTVTLFASAEGEWTVEVMVGKKRVVRALPVQPAEVAQAARSLPEPVTEAIEASLAAARTRQTERVEQLRAELESAQRTLRELGG